LCPKDSQWYCNGSCKRTGEKVVNLPSDGVCQEGIVFVNGEYVRDSLSFGGITVKGFKFIDSHHFQQRAGQLDADFNFAAGLGKENILTNMKDQGIINYMSLGIHWNSNTKFVTFGGYESYMVKNDWTHHKLYAKKGAWVIGLTDMIIGKKRYKKLPLVDYSKKNYFTFDTSLNGLAMPRKYLHNLRLIFEKYVKVTSKTDFTFYAMCNNVDAFPKIYI